MKEVGGWGACRNLKRRKKTETAVKSKVAGCLTTQVEEHKGSWKPQLNEITPSSSSLLHGPAVEIDESSAHRWHYFVVHIDREAHLTGH